MWELFGYGPEGIFLKRAKDNQWSIDRTPPFVHVRRVPYGRDDRLFFGKALVYPLAAAPLVRLAGLNGMLLFNVLLLVGVFLGGYYFLRARSSSMIAAVFALGFLGASIAPLYVVWLTPEVFNLSLVFYAYFLWLYKEVAPPASGPWGRFLRSRWSDAEVASSREP